MNQHQTEKRLVKKAWFCQQRKSQSSIYGRKTRRRCYKNFLVGSRFSTVGTFFFFFQEGKEADTLIKSRAKSGSARG